MNREILIMAVVRHLGIHKQPIDDVGWENKRRLRRKVGRYFSGGGFGIMADQYYEKW